MNGPHGPFFSTISLPQLSQNSFSGTSSAPGALRSGLAAKFSLVKSQLTCSTKIFLPLPAESSVASTIAATRDLGSATSFENTFSSSTVARTVMGNLSDVVIFFVTAFGSFFQGPKATVTGFVRVKLEHE